MLISLLKSLDILAPLPSFTMTMDGKKKVQTLVGAALSVLFIVVLGLLGYYVIKDVFDTSSPTVSEVKVYPKQAPVSDAAYHLQLPILFINESTTGIVLTPESVQKYMTITLTNFNNDKTTRFDLVHCRDLWNDDNGYLKKFPKDEYNQDLLNTALCFDTKNMGIPIFGRYAEDIYSKLEFAIRPCTLPGNKCETDLQKISDVQITFIEAAPVLDPTNYEDPLTYVLDYDAVRIIEPLKTKKYDIKLTKTEITETRGIFFPKRDNITYSQIQSKFFDTLPRDPTQLSCVQGDTNCNPYFLTTLRSSGAQITLTRTYYTFPAALSKIGGFFSALQIFAVIYGFYHMKVVEAVLVKRIYQLKEKKSWCWKKNQEWKNMKNAGEGITEVPKEIIQKAYRSLETNIDLVTFAREMFMIKFLTSLLLQEYQRTLVPLSSLSQEVKSQDEETGKGKKEKKHKYKPTKSNPKLPPNKMSTETHQGLKLELALAEIQSKMVEKETREFVSPLFDPYNPNIEHIVTDQIDTLLAQNLAGSVFLPLDKINMMQVDATPQTVVTPEVTPGAKAPILTEMLYAPREAREGTVHHPGEDFGMYSQPNQGPKGDA